MLNNEAGIVKMCKDGDQNAFGLIYDAYIEKIYKFIYYKTSHKETAEDLTSITFTKAFDKIKSFDDSSNFSSWIYTIARNTVIDHYRTHKESIDIKDAWDIPDGSDIERDVDTKRKIDQVKGYLTGLTKEQQEIVIMRVWNELSYKEIAEVLGKSEASCKMTFSRAVAKIRSDVPLGILAALIINM